MPSRLQRAGSPIHQTTRCGTGKRPRGYANEVRADLTHSIKLVNTGTFYICREMKREIISTEKNVLLCATYIPPLESPYVIDDSFSILEVEINHFQAQEHVLVCGDLNARTGQEHDTLSTQGYKHLLTGGDSIPSKICPLRHNYEKTTNKNRPQLLQLCHTLGLYIVNGRL